MLVSIITPCLNPGHRLERCLESVKAQTYNEIEHIIVDGGSTDGTVELLTAAGVPFTSEPDRGQSDALNKGFARARGELLGWLNADDILLPDATAAAVAAFANPLIGWVYGDSLVRREGGPDFTWRPPATVNETTLELGCPLPQPGSLLTRWALERVGPLDESLHLVMDYDLWLRLVELEIASAYLPQPLAIFELHDDSKSGSIGRGAFFREEATVLLKHGQPHAAALAFGRAAAAESQGEDGLISPRRLRAELERMHADPLISESQVAPGVMAAAAAAEAAVLELRQSPRGLRHLAARGPWRYAATRRRLKEAAGRSGSRLLRRSG